MSAVPDFSAEEERANATFDALMWALSRPGRTQTLPEPGEAPIIEALIDRECSVYSADPTLFPAILRSGASLAEIERADHVFAGRLTNMDTLRGLSVGSDLYPDDGATLFLNGEIGTGATLRISGAGIDGADDLRIGGLPQGFWTWRAEKIRYPMGFDAFVLDGSRILGLPRSTIVEVL